MHKKYSFYFAFLLIITSCKNEISQNSGKTGYVISIAIENANNQKAFLHKFNASSIRIIDSVLITNNKASFLGTVDLPERYLLTIEHVFGGKILILENDSIAVIITNTDLVNAEIFDSNVNTELSKFQHKLETIYNKVDILFPEMQRARLSNDAEKLLKISGKMKEIELEGIEYNIKYVLENPNSFISGMILNDLSKRDPIDLIRIDSIYKKLSKKVKSSPDSEELRLFLELNYK